MNPLPLPLTRSRLPPLFEGADDPAPLWEDFNAVVTNGDSITGVLNPNSGPMPGSDVDKLLYDNILTFLNKGSYGDGTGPQPKVERALE